MTDAIDPRWAWEPYRPGDKAPWNLLRVGHLYRRAAFGATWDELQTGLSAGPDKLIDELLQGRGGDDAFDARWQPFADSVKKGNNDGQLAAWWLGRLLDPDNPHLLREKITLFWHNHFATSNAKVRSAGAMLGQYALLRKHALGNFRDLLQEMSKDPAMLVWLDTARSKKGMPNENYARELMELFSLGVGNYTEKDIREAAKAFTGWELRDTQAYFNKSQYDDSEKTVLGKTGPWTGADIVNVCLEQPACATFLATKLFRFLVSETVPPAPELIAPLAEKFHSSGYNFGALVATVLRSNLFFDDRVIRSRIKSPVDFGVGIVRVLGGRGGVPDLAKALQGLGQHLFHPPSVKGWDGGPTWLNAQTLLFRQNLSLALCTREDFPAHDRSQPRRYLPVLLCQRYGKQADADVVDFFLQVFLQNDVPGETRGRLVSYLQQARQDRLPSYWTEEDGADQRIQAVCHLVLTLPEFQLD